MGQVVIGKGSPDNMAAATAAGHACMNVRVAVEEANRTWLQLSLQPG
jgi:hypothetical protein